MSPLTKLERAAASRPVRAAILLVSLAAIASAGWLALSSDAKRSEAAGDQAAFVSVIGDALAPLPELDLSREQPPGREGLDIRSCASGGRRSSCAEHPAERWSVLALSGQQSRVPLGTPVFIRG